MKNFITLAVIIFLISSEKSFAQSSTYRKVNQTTNEVNSAVKNTKSSMDSTAQAIREARKLISELIPAKNKSQTKSAAGNQSESQVKPIAAVSLFISGIEYEDDNIELLCNSLKNIDGVSGINKNYKNNTVGITINSKLNPLVIWDALPKNVRKLFKMVETSESAILLTYKAETPDK